MTKRERCIQMLEEIGFIVKYCKPATGYWKQKKADVYSWEFHGIFKGLIVCGGCWSTMTECVKAGALEYDARSCEVYPIRKSETLTVSRQNIDACL